MGLSGEPSVRRAAALERLLPALALRHSTQPESGRDPSAQELGEVPQQLPVRLASARLLLHVRLASLSYPLYSFITHSSSLMTSEFQVSLDDLNMIFPL